MLFLLKIWHTKKYIQKIGQIFLHLLLIRNVTGELFVDVKKLVLIFLRHDNAVEVYVILKRSFF